MEIIQYIPEYKNDFIRLNTSWIEKYFSIEQEDLDTLNNIDYLLENGAMIFFAVENGAVLATSMALPVDKDNWEICKLASDERYQGKGAGSAVFKACMDYAIDNNAKKLILVSNSILKPALQIYKNFGFKEIPVDSMHNYQRGDIQFEYTINQ